MKTFGDRIVEDKYNNNAGDEICYIIIGHNEWVDISAHVFDYLKIKYGSNNIPEFCYGAQET